MKPVQSIVMFYGVLCGWMPTVTGFAATEPPAPNPDRAFLGVQLLVGTNCNVVLADYPNPICVAQVRPGGAAERAGLQTGDVLLRWDQTRLTDMDKFLPLTQGLRAGQHIDFEIQRAGHTQSISVQLEERDRGSNAGAAPGASPSGPVLMPTQTDACEGTRNSAASSSATPGLPYHKLPPDITSQMPASILGDKQATVSLQGDVLTLVVRSNESVVRVVGSIECALDRVVGTDLWSLRLQMPNWDQAIIGAEFLAIHGPADAALPVGLTPTQIATVAFRGSKAPVAPLSASPLRGSIRQATLQSKMLSAPRDASVYLPPGAGSKPLPVLYMADGQAIAPFAAIAESLMDSGRVARFAIVGEHSGRYAGDPTKPFDLLQDVRAREYLPDPDPPQFALHMRFFVEELLPWAQKQYGLSAERGNRAVMGYSNGGAFVETLGAQHPELFAHVLPFSPANTLFKQSLTVADPKQFPQFLFAAGQLEPWFLMAASTDTAGWKSKGVGTDKRWYLSGHDILMWEQALADYLPQVFPVSNR